MIDDRFGARIGVAQADLSAAIGPHAVAANRDAGFVVHARLAMAEIDRQRDEAERNIGLVKLGGRLYPGHSVHCGRRHRPALCQQPAQRVAAESHWAERAVIGRHVDQLAERDAGMFLKVLADQYIAWTVMPWS